MILLLSKCLINNKIAKLNSICGTMQKTLRKNTRKETQLQFLQGNDNPNYNIRRWVLSDYQRRDLSRIHVSEMRFLRYVKGYTLQHQIRNKTIRRDLNNIQTTGYTTLRVCQTLDYRNKCPHIGPKEKHH